MFYFCFFTSLVLFFYFTTFEFSLHYLYIFTYLLFFPYRPAKISLPTYKCFFPSLIFMFTALEHVFTALEHVFTALKQHL